LKPSSRTIHTALLFSVLGLLISPAASFAGGAVTDHAPKMGAAFQAAAPAAQATPAPAIAAMSQELDREMPILSKADPAAYYIRYTLTSSDRMEVSGSNGALLSSEHSLSRWIEAQVRVGTYALDNTHQVGNAAPDDQASYGRSAPVDDDPGVLRRAVWAESQ